MNPPGNPPSSWLDDAGDSIPDEDGSRAAPDEREMPLFPLNLVLFPGMPLPLQIFEPRYLEMIDVCLAGDRAFGVALISAGAEVGERAEVWPVGTVAHIEQVERLQGGRLALITQGVQRFRIVRRLPDDPYPRALVSLLDDETQPAEGLSVVTEVQELLLQYLHAVARRLEQDWGDLDIPDDPALLSYVAGAVLPGGLPEKQRLLQTPTAAARLEQLIPMLRQAREDEEKRPESSGRMKVTRFEPALKLSPN